MMALKIKFYKKYQSTFLKFFLGHVLNHIREYQILGKKISQGKERTKSK